MIKKIRNISIAKYLELITLIILGIICMRGLWTDYADKTPRNTNHIVGYLESEPYENKAAQNVYRITISLQDHDDTYSFSNISRGSEKRDLIMQLKSGDKIEFYAKKTTTGRGIRFKKGIYKNYSICAATTDRLGEIISFEQYNYTSNKLSSDILPIMGIVLLLIGVVRFSNTKD